MDIPPNLPPTTSLTAAPTTGLDRSVTKKVTPIDASNKSLARPAERPFVAQVVTARLSGTEFPQNPSEIAPPDRTLRPYDVPMLPYVAQSDTPNEANGTDVGPRPNPAKSDA
jgi:hypothetical protein